MKKIVRLTESELMKLVGRIVKEQEEMEDDENAFNEHMITLDHIANHFNRNTTEEELDFMIDEIEYEVGSAMQEELLSDEELDELVDYAEFLIDELVSEFRLNQDFNSDLQETNQRLEKRLLGEQESDRKQNYLSKGYIDVTDGFKKKSYALQIADGTYKCDGAGYNFKIVTNDGKDTGYVVIMMFGVRGMITGPLTVSNNGTSVSVDFGEFDRLADSILYNEKLNQVKVKTN